MGDEYYQAKYETLVNAILNCARVSSLTGTLYTVDDERIFNVLKDLEPEKYKAKKEELLNG